MSKSEKHCAQEKIYYEIEFNFKGRASNENFYTRIIFIQRKWDFVESFFFIDATSKL